MDTVQSFCDTVSKWGLSDKIAFSNCVLTGLFLLATVISVVCAFRAYKHEKNRARKESACNLAKYYAENIINQGVCITEVYTPTGYVEKIKETFPIDHIKSFTYQEMEALVEASNHPMEEFIQAAFYVQANFIINAKLKYSKLSSKQVDYINSYDANKKFMNERPLESIILDEFNYSINTFLNTLEWFSMQCRYGIADENLLYQSLHQTFLSDVQMLYFHISCRNINSEDKFYTNVIWLFDCWKNRLEKYKKKNQREKERANKKYERARRNLKNAEQSTHHGKPI